MCGMEANWVPMHTEGLQVNELPDGYVIYQPSTERVHYLNGTAAVVFEMCNGKVAADVIPGLVKQAYDLAETPATEVEQCLARFLEEGLVTTA
jgi:hypothetical protein